MSDAPNPPHPHDASTGPTPPPAEGTPPPPVDASPSGDAGPPAEGIVGAGPPAAPPAGPAPGPTGEGSWWADPSPAPPGAGDTDVPRRSPRRPVVWLAAGAVALAAVGGGVAYAATRDDGTQPVATDGAASSGPSDAATVRQPGGRGEITAIDGTSLTVETEGGTTTLATDDDTSVADTADGSLSDIEVGDDVMVLGEADDDGAVTADRLVELDRAAGRGAVAGGPSGGEGGPMLSEDGAPPDGKERPDGAEGMPPDGEVVRGGPGGGTAGQVTAIDGDTLTITTVGDDTEVTDHHHRRHRGDGHRGHRRLRPRGRRHHLVRGRGGRRHRGRHLDPPGRHRHRGTRRARRARRP